GYFIVHDMLLTKKDIIFVIPPLRFDLGVLFSGKGAAADALRFFPGEPMRIIVLDKEGKKDPVTIEWPAHVVFHHGNAFRRDGRIVVDTILSPDTGVLDAVYPWTEERFQRRFNTRLTRLVLDPERQRVESHTVLAEEQEFPRYDLRCSGEDARFLYTLKFDDPGDPMASSGFSRRDLHRGIADCVEARKGRTLGEVVFVPRSGEKEENSGWLLMQGYDASKDESYLEIRDADDLGFLARVWTGRHFPLGFHGNFCPGSFVSAD
ncbi:MAG TPA: carotenoid oxygenase family protein, partial [Thermodesulfobacteriota bacterium]|nr:carotenoid oxygenase family protein [Thermodesulfobacteriota bacterium]